MPAPLVLVDLLFRVPALRQIKDKADPRERRLIQTCPGDQHRHPGAIFVSKLFLERDHGSSGAELIQCLQIARSELVWGQMNTALVAEQLVSAIANHLEKPFVYFSNLDLVSDNHANDIRLDQRTPTAFAIS